MAALESARHGNGGASAQPRRRRVGSRVDRGERRRPDSAWTPWNTRARTSRPGARTTRPWRSIETCAETIDRLAKRIEAAIGDPPSITPPAGTGAAIDLLVARSESHELLQRIIIP
jgi:hypothetical protein